jgi:HrpA-like RNA helicase
MEFHKPQIESTGYKTAIELVKAFDTLESGNSIIKPSVLVFLPGIFEIEEMHRLMENVMVSE